MIWILLAAALTAADLYIKTRVRKGPSGIKRDLFGGRLEFRRVFNKGLVGSRFAENEKAVRCVSAAGAILLAVCFGTALFSQKSGPAEKAGMSILAGGAAGNLIERFRYGKVTDYLRIRTERKAGRLIFNLADLMIAAGGLIAVIAALIERTE